MKLVSHFNERVLELCIETGREHCVNSCLISNSLKIIFFIDQVIF